MTSFTLGSRYVLDESAGLQSDSDDRDVVLSSLPATFSTYLFTTLGLSNSFAVANGAAHSAASIIAYPSAGPVAALTLTDSANGLLDGDDSGLTTVAGNRILLWATSDPHIVLGKEEGSGDVVFAVYLDAAADNKSASLWTVQFEAIHNPTGGSSFDEVVDLGNSLKVGASGDISLNLGTLSSGQLYFGSFGDPKDADADPELAVIVIAKDLITSDGDKADTINTSKGGGAITIGVSNQMFDPGEGAYFTFVTGMTGSVVNGKVELPSAGSNLANPAGGIVYDGLYTASGASFSIVQVQGGGNDPRTDVRVSAYLEGASNPQGSAFVAELGNDAQVRIDALSVKVTKAGVDITAQVIRTQNGMSVDIGHVPTGATVSYVTVDAGGLAAIHNRTLIENVTGNPFDIGGFGLVGPPIFTTIGQLIGFGDDGPVAAVSTAARSAITDESTTTAAGDIGGTRPFNDEVGAPALTLVAGQTRIGYALAQLVDVSGSSFGTDGARSKVVSLVVSDGADSGLDTTAGNDILLYQVSASLVVGREGGASGAYVFGISIDQSGLVTTEQYGSVDHLPQTTADQVATIANAAISAKVVVTDGDGDVAQQTIAIGAKIGFEDDGPTVSLSLNSGVTLVVDESVGADPNDLAGAPVTSHAAADDETASADGIDIGYAMATGAALFTSVAETGQDDEGATVLYSLRLDSGATTLTVSGHSGAAAVISLVQVNALTVEGRYNGGIVAFRMTILADTGNVAFSQFAALSHTDPNQTDEALALGAGLISAVRTVIDGDGDSAVAAVDIGAIVSIEDDAPMMDPNSPDDLVVNNTIPGDSDSGSLVSDGGQDLSVLFKFLNPDSSGDFQWNYADVDGIAGTGQNELKGTYKGSDLYTLFVRPDGTYDFTLIGKLPDSSLHLSTAEIKAGAPDTHSIEVGAIETTDFVRISGDSTVGDGFINESNGFVGIDNGNLDPNETLILGLFADVDPNTVGDGIPTPVSGMLIGTKSAKSSTYHIVLKDAGGTIIEDYNQTVLKNGTIDAHDSQGALFTTAEITKLSGPALKIGVGDITILRPAPDAVLDFDLRLTDKDGDHVDTAFSVSIDGNGNGVITAPIGAFAASLSAATTTLMTEMVYQGFDAGISHDLTAAQFAMF